MIHINEWDPVPWDSPLPARAAAAAPAPRPKARTALVDAISGRLSKQPRPPMAVHFYQGEGLRWIRVGFGERKPLAPAAVATVGQLIAECVGDEGTVYFHALRPHDMLFFVEGGKAKSQGMGPEDYGLPLEQVLKAWRL